MAGPYRDSVEALRQQATTLTEDIKRQREQIASLEREIDVQRRSESGLKAQIGRRSAVTAAIAGFSCGFFVAAGLIRGMVGATFHHVPGHQPVVIPQQDAASERKSPVALPPR